MSQVVPLSEEEFSPLVVKIITKAMNPNPDLRYQTAAEMLADLQHLHQDDPRIHRLKRQAGVGSTLILLCLVAGVFAAFVGLKRIQTLDSWAKLVEYSKSALADGDTTAAVDYALQALPEKKDIFTPPLAAAAQEALTNALGVYELEDTFQAHLTIELPSEPLKMTISQSGTKAAAVYAYDVAIFDMETGTQLPAPL